ncbi:MAG: sigma factor-like helix-turn-helix DNA-binding protein [Thermogemmata sp.]|nr:sigma factor-like helix-turn-helix DNA-binding protein [Thermogemmata sp.]
MLCRSPIPTMRVGALKKWSWTPAPRRPTPKWSRPTTCNKSWSYWTRWIRGRRLCSACALAWTTRNPKPSKEIGERLGLTRERVRQIENEALAKLCESLCGD